jgi:hypothetical protein
MQHQYQLGSRIPIHTIAKTNTPLLPRVVTPMTGQAASPRVRASSHNLPPHIFVTICFMEQGKADMSIALGTNHCSQQHFANAVVHPITGKQMKYMALVNDPDLQPLRKRGFSNEACRLFQGIHNIPGTKTC